MWTAWFIRRFPRSDSRQATRPPEDTRRGAVAGREVVPAGEAGDVTDVAEHRGGYRGADPEDLGHGGAGGPDSRRELLLDVAALDIDAAQAGRELLSQDPAGRPSCAARLDLVE